MNDSTLPPKGGFDDKDFVVIRRIEDITSRLDFRSEIDLVLDPIKQPLGRHPFTMRCGRKGCESHRAHHKGWLVRTQAGLTTVIGWRCGEELLGEVWGRFTNIVESREEQARQREILRLTAARLPELRAAIQDLRMRPRGLDWLERSRNAFQKYCPKRLLDNLKQRSKLPAGDAIHDEYRLSEREREERKATGTVSARDAEFSRKRVGTLKGLDVLKRMPDSTLWRDVLEPLQAIEESGADGISYSSLAHLAKKCSEIDRHLSSVEERLKNAQLFFTEENFAQFSLLQLDAKTRSDLSRFKWDFDGGRKA